MPRDHRHVCVARVADDQDHGYGQSSGPDSLTGRVIDTDDTVVDPLTTGGASRRLNSSGSAASSVSGNADGGDEDSTSAIDMRPPQSGGFVAR
jgi:hypothetical protein